MFAACSITTISLMQDALAQSYCREMFSLIQVTAYQSSYLNSAFDFTFASRGLGISNDNKFDLAIKDLIQQRSQSDLNPPKKV